MRASVSSVGFSRRVFWLPAPPYGRLASWGKKRCGRCRGALHHVNRELSCQLNGIAWAGAQPEGEWPAFAEDSVGATSQRIFSITAGSATRRSVRSGYRSVRANALMSSISSAGCSSAAKWPPCGISVQRTML